MVPNLTVFTCLSKIQIPHKSIYLFYLHVHYAWIYVYCVCLETHGARRGLRFPGTGICEPLCGAGHQTQAPWKSSRYPYFPISKEARTQYSWRVSDNKEILVYEMSTSLNVHFKTSKWSSNGVSFSIACSTCTRPWAKPQGRLKQTK